VVTLSTYDITSRFLNFFPLSNGVRTYYYQDYFDNLPNWKQVILKIFWARMVVLIIMDLV